MEFTKLEKDILNWIKQQYMDNNLNLQIDNIKIIKREYTGHGFFIDFKIDKNLPKLDINKFKNPIDGPIIKSKDIDYDGQSILFHKDGYINLLELFANGDKIKENIENYNIVNWEDYY